MLEEKAFCKDLPGMDELTVPGFAGRPAIAVLAFQNLSVEPEQEYLADEIAEDLILRLSAWRGFPVIARNSSFTYKGRALDAKPIGQELGVRYLIEGSVQRTGERVTLNAQLVDTTIAASVCAKRYEGELGDIFALLAELTEAIVESAYPEVKRSQTERTVSRTPQGFAGWEAMQKGWWNFHRFTQDANTKARSLFLQSIDLDPQLARAFGGLSFTYDHDILYQWSESLLESIAELDRAARQAVSLDDQDPIGFIALGLSCRVTGRQDEMVRALSRASELSPSHPAPYRLLGTYLPLAGRVDEGIANLRKAMRLNPRDPFMHESLLGMALAHTAAGGYEEAIEWAQRAVVLRPDWTIPYLVIAGSNGQLDRVEAAQTAVQELSRLKPRFTLSDVSVFLSAAAPAYVERAVGGLRKAGLQE